MFPASPSSFFALLAALVLGFAGASSSALSEYTNPVLPGWHSDPSCVFVEEWDNTFFCSVSSFLAFPGLPIYASKDLVNWRLVSHALTRPEQIPQRTAPGYAQQDGPYAPTLRFRDGLFYVTASFFNTAPGDWPIVEIAIHTTSDPYDSAAWSNATILKPGTGLDPDMFWDDDGQAYMSYAGLAGILLVQVNLMDGAAGPEINIWNGTGGRNVEAPHIYKKDGFYYLVVAEGGTELDHVATIARSTSVTGPYESYSKNPILTNRQTNEYFQTVGHADFFQDGLGNWWGVALATRSGPEWEVYPMGREAVLFPFKWEESEWPVLEQVRGRMSGPLPPRTREVPGSGPFVDDPDDVDFSSSIPANFLTWRPQDPSVFQASPPGYPRTLRITPSRFGLSGGEDFDPSKDGLAFISRKQTSTLFEYSVDVSFLPTVQGEEAGVSVFLTQQQHIDLSIIHLPSPSGKLLPHFRFRVEASGKPGIAVPETRVVSIPRDWLCQPIRLIVSTPDDKTFLFSASSTKKPGRTIELGRASATIVSGGSGPFTGTLIGAFATSNGGEGTTPAYLSRWKYTLLAQKIGDEEVEFTRTNKRD